MGQYQDPLAAQTSADELARARAYVVQQRTRAAHERAARARLRGNPVARRLLAVKVQPVLDAIHERRSG